MCGIVGLLLRDPALRPQLGAMITPMLDALGSRGPDSTGIGMYSEGGAGRVRLSVHRCGPEVAWEEVAVELAARLGDGAEAEVAGRGDSALITWTGELDVAVSAVQAMAPRVRLIGFGHVVEVVKDVGGAAEVCRKYDITSRHGYLAIGHTRMATESAVTAAHSHPFVTAPDLCLVHNGSFSNHASVRRRLEAQGVSFDSDNDSEVAARLIASHLAQGDDVEQALRWMAKDLDGFYTVVVTTPDYLAILRDPFSCKPAVVAETEEYVAIGSEYRALAGLPGIETARVFEPAPQEIYSWSR